MKTRFIQIAFVLCLAAMVLLLPAPFRIATADGPVQVLAPESAVPYHPYSVLAAKWWKWVGAAPVSVNPVLDPTGEHCAQGQSGDVWFLAGTFGGTVTRTCTVPRGKLLFFPIYNVAWAGTEPTDTAKMAREAVKEAIDQVNVADLSVEIDGKSVSQLERYRIYEPPSLKSLPIFNLNLPEDNVFGLDPGVYKPCSTDGYYLLIAPLAPGSHTIHIAAKDFLDVTYQLTIKKAK